MSSRVTTLLSALVVGALAPAAAAQQQPMPPMPAPPAASMVATAKFLFVVRDHTLYQFDVRTLKLLHSFDFDGQVAPPAQFEVTEEVAIQEPPAAEEPKVDAGPTGAAVTAALDWLAAHQDEDGRWDADGFMKHDEGPEKCDGQGNGVHDVGDTGLAMLAMLANGSNLRSGTYKDNLKRAAEWLVQQQQDNGLLGANASHDFIYDHAIATYALCEACGLSEYKALRPAVQKALNYLEAHRNPYSVWRYQPRDNDNDTSVTTWAMFALVSGKFFRFQVNENALQLIATWYDQVTDETGKAGYTKRGEPSSRHPGDHSVRFPVERGEAMTAAALAGRFMLGQDPKATPVMTAAADLLQKKPPQWKADRIDAYYWYMGTVAMYQTGGKHWRAWFGGLRTLLPHQRKDGVFAGSWDPVGVWDEDGGRIYSTALYALCLQTVSRYAKLVK